MHVEPEVQNDDRLPYRPQNYIVTFRDGTIPAVRAVAANNAGAALRHNYSIINAIAVTVPNANALARFENNPSVLSIVPDRAVFAFQQANAKGGGRGKPPKDEDHHRHRLQLRKRSRRGS